MPAASHPQAKFDPISPDLDLHSLVDEVTNLKWAQRVPRNQLRNLGAQEFEKLVLMHVIIGGKPLVIEGFDAVLPKWLFSPDWLGKKYDKKEERVRDIVSQSDVPMTTGHYLRSLKQLTNQWTSTNFRDERRQRLYLKDIDCPPEWHDALQKILNPVLFYLNSTLTRTGAKSQVEDEPWEPGTDAASAGDLMSSLPREMRAENLMCYIGHEGTYTPAHREMCASLGQNIMVEASGDEHGEKPGSSIWFMTESKDRAVVREYFLSMLGHDIEIEKHFAQVNAWKKAPFDVYVVEQRVGDLILIPPLAAHQVWNRGTRTMKVAWNRTTVETLELALQEALPKARLVCRDEQYKNKAMVYYTLQIYYQRLQLLEDHTAKTQLGFIDLGRDAMRNLVRARQLAADFKKLFILFTQILIDEVFASKEKDVEFVPFDSCITCSYCRSNIFNRFLTCRHCVRTLVNGDEDTYDICMECYAMGRSCVCLSGLQWCEQWSWSELVNNHEIWRKMVISNDGFIDANISPQPLEVAKQLSGKRSVAQICQEELRRRPWKDITRSEKEPTPIDTDEGEDGEQSKAKKNRRKKNKKGDVRRCHVCCRKEFSYRMQMCSNPDCVEGYCFGVLYRAFDMMPQEVLQDEHWMCPKCLGICNCGHCRRSGNTKPYTPKNTSLGHDTRSVADDRSVEALVDFRLHNLAWLKAAGEESRGRDTRRMQKLREQADTAKAEDLSNEHPEHDNATLAGKDSAQALSQHDGLSGLLDGGGSHQHGNETARSSFTQRDDIRHGAESSSLSAPWLNGDQASNGLNGDYLSYPDPPVFAAQRIGMGYYEQDDTPDKILFDPYQAPTAEDLREDESDIPEFVKKSIRSAKRKAKKDNEDPDFIIKSHHRKRPRSQRDPDFLDSMDPALFNEAPATSGPEISQEGGGPDAEDITSAHKGDAEVKVNEPLLRHAKPKASYVEVEDVDIEGLNDNEQANTPPAREAGKATPEPVDERAPEPAVDEVLELAVDDEVLEPKELEAQVHPPPFSGVSAKPKRRGRPPAHLKRPSAASREVQSTPEENAEETTPSNDAQRRGPGRPRKSVSNTGASKQLRNQDDERALRGNKPRRGRPPASEDPKSQSTKRAAAASQQFMSLKERMALRGKAVKIAKRGQGSSPALSASQPDPVPKATGVTVQLPSFTPVNRPSISNQASQRKDANVSSATMRKRGISVDTPETGGSGSDSGSSDDDDIPAEIDGTQRVPRSTFVAIRGRGRPRGRPSMRSGGRGRG
ncbi:JmjC domain-containing protein [Beauveria brongniartii RCEF 3172]|uniref:JmjC domain-containing protein n=1 Tax=Beauveria brongniartii RCEF 3172 TaxID=1081107 RepID=A0A166YQE2_9HYPO|nr:JmjC domain-containing protein [Beauveria brongniartii RCEF 3172]